MNIPAVSVIIAAYNAEKYIRRCLDSIAAQTLSDWECIIVNDGSTDATAVIADGYAAEDGRFRVIHKPNGGVASARQAGLDEARGEFSIHADPDDWVEPDMLEALVGQARADGADMVLCDMSVIFPDGKREYWKQKPHSSDHFTVLGQMLGQLHGSLCNKLIRQRCYADYGVRFLPGVNVCEDQIVVLWLLSHDMRVSYVNKAFYHYDRSQNPVSLVNRKVSASDRLRPLEFIAGKVDISPVRLAFDLAVFKIAYDTLFVSGEDLREAAKPLRKHALSVRRSPSHWYTKWIIFLALKGFYLPARLFRRFIKNRL